MRPSPQKYGGSEKKESLERNIGSALPPPIRCLVPGRSARRTRPRPKPQTPYADGRRAPQGNALSRPDMPVPRNTPPGTAHGRENRRTGVDPVPASGVKDAQETGLRSRHSREQAISGRAAAPAQNGSVIGRFPVWKRPRRTRGGQSPENAPLPPGPADGVPGTDTQ